MNRLFRFEITMLQRNPVFRLALALLAAFLIFAGLHQQRELAAQEDQAADVLTRFQDDQDQALARLQEVERGEKTYDSLWDDPRGYYTWSRRVLQFPQHPFNLLAVGQRDLYAPLVEATIYKKAEPAGRDIANPVSSLMGSFDPAFVLVFLVPLFIIGFSQGLISRERELGIMPMLLMQPKGAWGVLGLKTLPRFAVLSGAVVLFLLVMLPLAGIRPWEHPARTLWLAGLTAAYALFWFLAALALNLVVRSSAAHATALICLWAGTCIVLPAAVSTLSNRLYPIPSQIEVINAMREAGIEQDRRAQQIMEQYYHDHPELTTEANPSHETFFQFYKKSLIVGMEVEGAMQPAFDHYAGQRAHQQALEQKLAFLSPSALFAASLEELAGSSGGQYKQFESAVSQFSHEWRMFFQERAFAGKLISTEDVAQFPQIQFTPNYSIRQLTTCLSTLMLTNLILGAMVVFALRGRASHKLL